MSWLYNAPFFVLVCLVAVSMLGALELGHRLGRVIPVADHQASSIAASILAVVGLLLAFSFSMASERLAQRRVAAVMEANSMGTFWLRTSLLPEPSRSALQSRFLRYLELHLEHRAARTEDATTEVLESEAGRLHLELWALLTEYARHEPEPTRLLLITTSLNSMIDDLGSVLAARENRLPDAIFYYLYLLVVVAGLVMGYRPRGERRSPLLWATFTLVISGVLLILVDMDRPRRGAIQTDVAPYLRLRASIAEERAQSR